jgi:hypothetical protein
MHRIHYKVFIIVNIELEISAQNSKKLPGQARDWYNPQMIYVFIDIGGMSESKP